MRACTWQLDGAGPCGNPVDDSEWENGYEWRPGEYWCEYHIARDTVGKVCMCCVRVLERVEDAGDWYIDNGGQLCPDHNPALSERPCDE